MDIFNLKSNNSVHDIFIKVILTSNFNFHVNYQMLIN